MSRHSMQKHSADAVMFADNEVLASNDSGDSGEELEGWEADYLDQSTHTSTFDDRHRGPTIDAQENELLLKLTARLRSLRQVARHDVEESASRSPSFPKASGDLNFFGAYCPKNKESAIVYQLFDKIITEGVTDVVCACYIPTSPGRIFFEARSPSAVAELCSGMACVYTNSLFSVPLEDRVALLRLARSKPLVTEGSWNVAAQQLLEPSCSQRERKADPNASIAPTPLFLRVGTHVEISKGVAEGARGTINQFTLDYALITVDEFLDPGLRKIEPVQTEVPLGDIVRLFDLGEHVEIKIGHYAGRSGIVGTIHGMVLGIVDLERRETLEVPSRFVDSFYPGGTSVSTGRLEDNLSLDMIVTISNGKHRGRRGVIFSIKRFVVIVEEFGSRMKLAVYKEDVMPNPKQPERRRLPIALSEYDYPDQKLQQEAFIELATAIGINLDEFSVTCDARNYLRSFVAAPIMNKAKIHNQDERVLSFWSFANTFKLTRNDLRRFEDDTKDEKAEPDRPDKDPRGTHLRRAFSTFAKGVHIDLGNGTQTASERFTLEQKQWEVCFISLASDLDIAVRYVGRHPVEGDIEKQICFVDHLRKGFEGQQVYVCDGHFKGLLGRVKLIIGNSYWVALDSPLLGASAIIIDGQNLLGKCGCRNSSIVRSLFDRKSVGRVFTSIWPSISPNTVEESQFHDPSGEGMWLFNAKIAELRKTLRFVVKIKSHPDPGVAGRREGRVLTDPNPPTHPLPKQIPQNVLVEYFLSKKDAKRTDSLPANSLSITRPGVKARHVVIHGDRIGEIVIYIRSDGVNAQVHKEGVREDVFYVSKSQICRIE